MRSALKSLLAHAVAAAAPQCRFDRAIFIFGHMRCGSTALSRVLCGHSAICGFGEAHVAYRARAALGQLLLAQWRRGAWKPGARHLHDKILHNRYDTAPPPGFTRARAIFLVREPEASIRSIRHLFRTIGSSEYATDGLAADYYAERLARLADLWRAFPAQRRLPLDHAELTADPDRALARISRFLALPVPLANAYAPGDPARHGSGDPLGSPRFSAIVRATEASRPVSPLALAPRRIAELQHGYAELGRLMQTSEPAPIPVQNPSRFRQVPEYSTPCAGRAEIRL